MKQKVALAFSGGLDTSFCVKYLSLEKDLEVHSVFINSGGFSKQEEEKIECFGNLLPEMHPLSGLR